MKLKQEIFEEFFKKCFSGKKPRDAAYALFFGEKSYCLCRQPGYDETDFLQANIKNSILNYPNKKDSQVAIYKKFVAFLNEKKGIPVRVDFPKISLDSSFDRQLFIVKYLQNEDARVADLPEKLWVSSRTIESDLARIQGKTDDKISVCGREFFIPEESMPRHRGKVTFDSTLHPLFMTENLTQVIIMLEGLKHMAENPLYQRYAETTAANIWEQLSDYAKDRIHKVIGPILPGDISWYDKLEQEIMNTFSRERDCRVPGDAILEVFKSLGERKFCAECIIDGKTTTLENCELVPGTYKFDANGNYSCEVKCDQGHMTLSRDNIIRTGFIPEELL